MTHDSRMCFISSSLAYFHGSFSLLTSWAGRESLVLTARNRLPSSLAVTGMTLPSLLAPDEKNGIPNSPQKVALTLDLDAEKEPELEPEEPQKPGKPSVFIVFQKVWLGYGPQPQAPGKSELLSPALSKDPAAGP